MSLPQKEPGAHKTILIVHSDVDMCNIIGEELKSRGFGVVIAQDGEVALTLFELYKDQIVLVLLDIILPKKDGFIVLKELKDIDLSLPVVMLTNLDGSEDIAKSKEAGAIDYIIRSKNSPQEIAEKVEKVLNN